MTIAKQREPTRLLDVPQASDALNVSQRTVRRLIAEGELSRVSIGRRVLIDFADLRAFIRRNKR